MLQIAPTSDRFLRDGQPEFVLADTAWAAFTTPTVEEWRAYVAQRRAQGFTAALVSILPIVHDRSLNPDRREPSDSDYFHRAAEYVEIALDGGITPMLVVLWYTYVPGTQANHRQPDLAMTDEQTREYLDTVLGAFASYQPIFIISGDDSFTEPAALDRYRSALDRIQTAVPDSLTSLHSNPSAMLPDDIEPHFYGYQSGHDGDHFDRTWQLAEQYLARPVRRPLMDFEPCYEGHGYDGATRRHTAAAVRRASWSSVLGGASAGLGYGAHGVWSWHRRGAEFTSVGWSGEPFPVEVALRFRGADDVALLRRIVEDHGLYGVLPRPDVVVDGAGVRAAATPDLSTIAVYSPEPTPIILAADGRVTAYDLEGRRATTSRLRTSGEHTVVEMPEHPGDRLLVFHR